VIKDGDTPTTHLPDKFVDFFAMLCQSAPDGPPTTVKPQQFVWETLVLNIEPRNALPEHGMTASGSIEITVVWADNSTTVRVACDVPVPLWHSVPLAHRLALACQCHANYHLISGAAYDDVSADSNACDYRVSTA
jgi:hypothetical protein